MTTKRISLDFEVADIKTLADEGKRLGGIGWTRMIHVIVQQWLAEQRKRQESA